MRQSDLEKMYAPKAFTDRFKISDVITGFVSVFINGEFIFSTSCIIELATFIFLVTGHKAKFII